jgi:hypothetical protein
MRQLLLTGAVLLVSVTVVPAQGSSDEKFTEDASSTFALLASQAGVGFFGDKSAFESFVKKSHLSKKDGGEDFGVWWAIWEGENTSGHVTTYAAFPDIGKKQNHFWVRFDLPTETPMPQALLSHLLGKARETAVSSGDTLELKLPFESVLGGCTESYTLRIRMTTGALVSNTVEDFCPLK